ncbi:aminotransferase class I/II-fold pyridoxal phosphate-dependent enzyme [Chitinophaga flava]|uniref:Aminotransferase n=1 Tax=Chitinophaga flava TaxID=2259036 RepID=A0A365XUT2_9BACT|nr:aminotransferase class I/II-fold pyridoxal phosphate-dependent enzyme [Chitinophaga flava]RBL89464.1 aminotransferase [Chitinophaga flava]
MQAIILAAGLGSRMGLLTEGCAKSMLMFNGRPILSHLLENLVAAGVHKVVLVIGYQGEAIREFVGDSYKNMEVEFITNLNYDKANNIYSMWLCKDHLMDNDSLIIEGDLIFDKELLQPVLALGDNVITVSDLIPGMNGSIVEMDHADEIYLSKTFNTVKPDTRKYKTVNIYKFSGSFCRDVYIPLLDKAIREDQVQLFYEDILTSDIVNKYFQVSITSKQCRWMEVDTPMDLELASLMFAAPGEKYEAISRMYGGYWKIPYIKDHYYLTNPYFPNEVLMAELKRNFEHLVMNYPSGRNYIDTLCANMLECPKAYVTAGNGASEIIKVLMDKLPGISGVVVPTFNEYLYAGEKEKVVALGSASMDFEIDLPVLIKLSENVDTLVLVNPNNPTGKIIEREVLMQLLLHLRNEGKCLVVDESFIDFSIDASLLEDAILSAFENLVIIKSLGKSFGIPGLRTGVIVTANSKLLQEVRASLPLWNINSIAEYFLEIFPRYRKQYLLSCERLKAERDYLFEQLGKIRFLSPLASEANFFLCRVSEELDPADLCEKLLDRYNILVKNCSGKPGFDNNSNYIRIGVRNREDNDYLINALLTF